MPHPGPQILVDNAWANVDANDADDVHNQQGEANAVGNVHGTPWTQVRPGHGDKWTCNLGDSGPTADGGCILSLSLDVVSDPEIGELCSVWISTEDDKTRPINEVYLYVVHRLCRIEERV